jgi:glyoxylase-like metal-dependent hydrolase (beta-lactamase superfamily II)
MQPITKTVFIDDQYPGVTLGVIARSRGLIQIDAPPSPEDGRTWRAALMNLSSGPERLLINMDAHPDRTLGARAMDCTVVAHEKTAQVFRLRPSTFKAQGDETGAEWEKIPGMGSVRWAPPEISFLHKLTLHWGEGPAVVEHHSGPTPGAVWVVLPEEKVVFIGDAVLKGQPPFLASADLEGWIESLNHLLRPAFKGYTIISGRGGAVNAQAIHAQLDFLKYARERLHKMGARKARAETTEKLVQPLLDRFRAPAARQKTYAQRLRYGLYHYYARHYLHSRSSHVD